MAARYFDFRQRDRDCGGESESGQLAKIFSPLSNSRTPLSILNAVSGESSRPSWLTAPRSLDFFRRRICRRLIPRCRDRSLPRKGHYFIELYQICRQVTSER